jgi:hypothetical protein
LTVGIRLLVGSGKVGEGPTAALSGSLAVSPPVARNMPNPIPTTTAPHRIDRPVRILMLMTHPLHRASRALNVMLSALVPAEPAAVEGIAVA